MKDSSALRGLDPIHFHEMAILECDRRMQVAIYRQDRERWFYEKQSHKEKLDYERSKRW